MSVIPEEFKIFVSGLFGNKNERSNGKMICPVCSSHVHMHADGTGNLIAHDVCPKCGNIGDDLLMG